MQQTTLKTFNTLYPDFPTFKKLVIDPILSLKIGAGIGGAQQTPIYFDESRMFYKWETIYVMLFNRYYSHVAQNSDDGQNMLMQNAMMHIMPMIYAKTIKNKNESLEKLNIDSLLSTLTKKYNEDPNNNYASTETGYTSTPSGNTDGQMGTFKLPKPKDKNLVLRKDATIRITEVTDFIKKYGQLDEISLSGWVHDIVNSLPISSLWFSPEYGREYIIETAGQKGDKGDKGDPGSALLIINSIAEKDIFKAAPTTGDKVTSVVLDPSGDGSYDVYEFTNKETLSNQAIYDVYKSHFSKNEHIMERFFTECNESDGVDATMIEFPELDDNATGNEVVLFKSVRDKIDNINEDQAGIVKRSVSNKAQDKFLTRFIEDGANGEVKFEAFDGKTRVSIGVLQNIQGQLEDGFRDSNGKFLGLKAIHKAILDSGLAKAIAERNEKAIVGIINDLNWIKVDVTLLNDFAKISSTAPGGVPAKAYLQAGDIMVSQDPKKANGVATKHYVDSMINHDSGKLKRIIDKMLLDETKLIKVKKTSTVAGVDTFEDTTVPYTSTSDLSNATHIIFKVEVQYASTAGDLYDEFFYPNYKKIGTNWECSNGQILDVQAYNNGKVLSNGIVDFGTADINTNNKETFLEFGQSTALPKGTDGGEWFATIVGLQIIEEGTTPGGGSGGGTEINNGVLVAKAGATIVDFNTQQQVLVPTVNYETADPNEAINKEMLEKSQEDEEWKTIDNTTYPWSKKDNGKEVRVYYDYQLSNGEYSSGTCFITNPEPGTTQRFRIEIPFGTLSSYLYMGDNQSKITAYKYSDGKQTGIYNVKKFQIRGKDAK